MQISRIQDRIQEMRISNAQATLEVNNSNQKNRLSTSCPSLNESADPVINLQTNYDNNTSTDNSNHRGSKIADRSDRNLNLNQRQRRAQDQMVRFLKFYPIFRQDISIHIYPFPCVFGGTYRI